MVNVTMINNTAMDFEQKIEHILACVQKCLEEEDIELLNVYCDDIGYKTPNFTTSGIYRLQGSARIHNSEEQTWSMIVKVIKPDSEEKNSATHHNYWRREAHVFKSGILNDLPNNIKITRCFGVEEQTDATTWIWMEHIKGEYADTLDEFSFIAEQLGQFNGAYLTGDKILPRYDWLCEAWLTSWTTASRNYAPDVAAYAESLSNDRLHMFWAWYQNLIEELDHTLESLQQLPRVLAHQDLSQMNMLLVTDDQHSTQLALIDWQFMSISGVGEDLGKLYGVNMSLGIIHHDQYEEFQTALYRSYLAGLRAVGWQGDEQLVRYGFCISTALRSIWEVPQFFSMLAQLETDPHNTTLRDRLSRLERILWLHKAMYTEAQFMMPQLLQGTNH